MPDPIRYKIDRYDNLSLRSMHPPCRCSKTNHPSVRRYLGGGAQVEGRPGEFV
jgi:hypothetical protein